MSLHNGIFLMFLQRVSSQVWKTRSCFWDRSTAVKRIWPEALWFLCRTLTRLSQSKSQTTTVTSASRGHFITHTDQCLRGHVPLCGTMILTHTAVPVHFVVSHQAHFCPSVLLCVTLMACFLSPVQISFWVIWLHQTPGHQGTHFSMTRPQWVHALNAGY